MPAGSLASVPAGYDVEPHVYSATAEEVFIIYARDGWASDPRSDSRRLSVLTSPPAGELGASWRPYAVVERTSVRGRDAVVIVASDDPTDERERRRAILWDERPDLRVEVWAPQAVDLLELAEAVRIDE